MIAVAESRDRDKGWTFDKRANYVSIQLQVGFLPDLGDQACNFFQIVSKRNLRGGLVSRTSSLLFAQRAPPLVATRRRLWRCSTTSCAYRTDQGGSGTG